MRSAKVIPIASDDHFADYDVDFERANPRHAKGDYFARCIFDLGIVLGLGISIYGLMWLGLEGCKHVNHWTGALLKAVGL